ncbi:uncharacterized protein BX664DRAFT_366232 [Halteromyces radiatus]|uniref:uncharacterized protein n=1 Tax=Halteromyces radiatus TaxID=101107 RepID=UPI0022200835|nr:uncharacterized protein BX664DRAFT_366232 [Halteromyces radiatus]KAI8084599.1 hypothetical protein BX664DRAFT_366232 [Halteromyces radiatus]
MEHFLTSYLHGNTSMVRVRGNTFGPDDPNNMANKLPDWLQKALASLTLTVPFQGTTHSDIIQSLTMDHIKIDFSMVTREPLVSGDATALLQLPREMQLSLDVTEIDPDVYIYLEKDSQEPFAQISPTTPCASKTIHRSEDNTIPEDMFMVKSRINRAPFKVLNGHENEFEKFLDRLYHQRNSTVYLQGTANAKVESDLGKLMVHDLKFKGQINTIGMQGMKNPPPKVTSMTIEKGYPDALQFKTRIIITNPSDIDINMGPITFVLSYNQIEIGNVTIENLNLLHGANNEFDAIGYISSEPTKHHDICWKQEVQLPSIVEFIGSYISGRVTHLKIFGKTGSTKSKYLESLMKRLEFMIQVPKFNKRPLLQDVQMNLLSSTVIFWLRNPFEDIDMRIMNINGSASYQVQKIGTMYANFMKEPLALPPVWCEQDECTGFVVQSPKIPVTMKKLGLEAISKALGGKIVIGVDSIVTVMIDSFLLTGLEYKRENITAIIKKTF